MNNSEIFYGYIHKQETPMDQEADSTVTFVKGEMYRIICKCKDMETMESYSGFYAKGEFLKARYSKSKTEKNRYVIDEILE